MFELRDNHPNNAVIKVIGIGGGGCNAVRHMMQSGIEGVEFIVANTDAQCLSKFTGCTVLPIGNAVTKGLGAGANPETGRQSALEDKERIAEAIKGSDILFITAGMGGGTGTGAAPVVAQTAKELGILTVAVVTKPFPQEHRKRMAVAEQGIEELSMHVDSIIVIPNAKLCDVYKNLTIANAFKMADDVLRGGVQGISELITQEGMVNVDFADVRTVMAAKGTAMMGIGIASGENRAQEAAQQAISCPLLDDIELSGARGILVNITASDTMTMEEYNEVGNVMNTILSDDAEVIYGMVVDNSMEDKLQVTVVATGLGIEDEQQVMQVHLEKETIKSPYDSVESVRLVSRSEVSTAPDYDELDKQPAVIRRQAGSESKVASSGSDDYFDIPAFLRKQAN